MSVPLVQDVGQEEAGEHAGLAACRRGCGQNGGPAKWIAVVDEDAAVGHGEHACWRIVQAQVAGMQVGQIEKPDPRYALGRADEVGAVG